MWFSAATSLCLFLSSAMPVDEKAEAPKYSVSFAGSSHEIISGGRGLFHIEIRAADGYKINAKAPLKISLSSEKLTIEKDALSHGDAQKKGDEHAPSFETGFTAQGPGNAHLVGTASFFVCNAELCERKTEKIDLSVVVKPAKKQG